jgi:ribosomal protein S1
LNGHDSLKKEEKRQTISCEKMTEKENHEETSFEAPGRKFFPGDQVSGKVLKVSKDTIFVDLGGKSESVGA